ncbi:sigma-54 interaction domain-containing protein [Candidatus Manganitrophus noduliformans]|uniref:AAA family ATPase n=1 Tax=Candidatus Manganitrophus noduliformans TaxID=2606439 RepID=A0A7X6ICN7_9BACT|nr:sigma 54-interacting transcriptional regulator [Candidatus Manganitrophus noduliformans]NKE72893.1 AAA family ATPase [Candidatus Manganitrophus noduliformans]
MDRRYILFIDLGPDSCLDQNLLQIQKTIGEALPLQKILLETINSIIPSRPLSYTPDLILFRPCSTILLEEALNRLRERWGPIPIVGLVCSKWVALHELYSILINRLDDFLSCPCREIDLILRLRRLLCRNRKSAEETKGDPRLESLVGEERCFVEVVEKIPLLARSDAAVLISGETGTGKELFARAIHYQGPRRGKPFIPVNCGALPDHLFENELFGHAKGAFTDASQEAAGLIAEAEGGTLFLDEIDAISPSAQVKLLRFLQDRAYRPLGAAKSRVADVRIIAASNANLTELVEGKLFRQDLYYRLHVLSLTAPPLRERSGDIPLLAAHFLAKYANQYEKPASYLSHRALQKLLAYPWPGNVRELEGVLQKAVVLGSSPLLQPEAIHLPEPPRREASGGDSLQAVKTRAIASVERAYLSDLLTRHQGNITQAAKGAGKKRQVLQRLLRKYGLERQTFQKTL